MGVLAAGGRKAHGLGDRQPGRIEAEVAGRAQHLGPGRGHGDDLGLAAPRCGHHHDAVATAGHRADRRGVEVDLVDGAVGPQDRQVVDAVLPPGEPHVVADEGVPGEAEHPLRGGHLEPAGGQLHEVLAVETVEVPPAVPVGDHVQHPVGAPLWLEERLPRRRHTPGTRQRSVVQVRHPELAVVPRQVRVVPLDPGQTPPVGRDPGPRHEVGP